MADAPFYPPGFYIGEIKSHRLGRARTGTPQFEFTVKILGWALADGELDELNEQYERTVYVYWTEKIKVMAAAQLAAMGHAGDPAQLHAGSTEPVSLAGKLVTLECRHETYNGRTRDKFYPRTEDAAPKPVEPELVSAISREWREIKRENKSGAVLLAGTEITDDDIPF